MARTFGIDARAAAEVPAGRGRVVREVLAALARLDGDERYQLYCRRPADLELDERFEWRVIDRPDPLWHLSTAHRASRECDAFLSTNSYLTAWFTRLPCAVIVYDLVPFIAGAQAQKRAARIERGTIDIGVRRAQALACISHATRRDLVARVPSAAPRAVVVPLAAGAHFAASGPEPAAERPYVLATGTLEPRKNLARLLDAWTGLTPALRDAYELVLVGPTGWDADTILARARSAGARITGYVPDAELAALYRGCELFCYPSLYEGFGLPVLEAMHAGAPVITSDVSSLPEVAGEAALLVDPLSVDAIRDAIACLLGDPGERDRLRAAGRVRAATFSWERTATELRDLLYRIGGR
ncbi:MAG: glycosyltransferase family 1 protein [Solirubrobacteraceae bacterium]